MRRRFGSLFAILCLLLLAAVLALWVRGYPQGDGLGNAFSDHATIVYSHRGSILLESWGDRDVSVLSGWTRWRRLEKHEYPVFGHDRDFVGTIFGFGYSRREIAWGKGRITVISIPFWFITLLPLPPLLLCATTWLKSRRRRGRSLCFHCGYDLRASVHRCPECGTPIADDGGETIPLPVLRNGSGDGTKSVQTKQFVPKLALDPLQGGKSWRTNCSSHSTA